MTNSKVDCKWQADSSDNNANFCYQCGAVTLMNDLINRCNVISMDKDANSVYNLDDNIYHNVQEAMTRIEAILHYAQNDNSILHKLDWYKFCDLLKTVAYAANCLKMTDDLAYTLANKSGKHEFSAPEMTPIRPEAILGKFRLSRSPNNLTRFPKRIP